MIIDRHTGSIAFMGGVISPHAKLSSFFTSDLGKGAKKLLESGEWLKYGVQVENSLNAVFVFKGGVLFEVHLCIRSLHDPVWAQWSAAEEVKRKAAHDALLEQQIGSPPYCFSWGAIESFYDERGGGSQIVIRYV